jgi:2-dehydropantoate 2-reductase
MGCFMAAKLRIRLSRESVVSLVTSRTNQYDALLRHGITIKSPNGTKHVATSDSDNEKLLVRVNMSVESSDDSKSDLAIIMTKGMKQTELAVRSALSVLNIGGCILTLQNGVGYADLIEDLIDKSNRADSLKLMVGSTSMGIRSEYEKGNHLDKLILHQSSLSGSAVIVDSAMPGADLISTAIVKDLLELTDMDVTVKPSHMKQSILWSKLVVSASLNPIAVLSDSPNGFIFETTDSKYINLLGHAVTEILEVAQKQNIKFDFSASIAATQKDPELQTRIDRVMHQQEQVLRMTLDSIPDGVAAVRHVLWVAHSTYSNINSMLADVRSGRTPEMESIIIPVISSGEKLGVDTPTLNYFKSILQK